MGPDNSWESERRGRGTTLDAALVALSEDTFEAAAIDVFGQWGGVTAEIMKGWEYVPLDDWRIALRAACDVWAGYDERHAKTSFECRVFAFLQRAVEAPPIAFDWGALATVVGRKDDISVFELTLCGQGIHEQIEVLVGLFQHRCVVDFMPFFNIKSSRPCVGLFGRASYLACHLLRNFCEALCFTCTA